MSTAKNLKITAYLNNEQQELISIYNKVKKLAQLKSQIFTYINPQFAKYCQLGNEENNRITILVENAAIGATLRFQTEDLLQKFSQNPSLKHIRGIQFKIRPFCTHTPNYHSSHEAKKPPVLSSQAAKIIKEIAESIKDPALRAVMEKIAKHTS